MRKKVGFRHKYKDLGLPRTIFEKAKIVAKIAPVNEAKENARSNPERKMRQPWETSHLFALTMTCTRLRGSIHNTFQQHARQACGSSNIYAWQ